MLLSESSSLGRTQENVIKLKQLIISISAVFSLSPQFVYPNTETTGNSLCLRWDRSRCLFLRSFSSAERIFISRSFSSLWWTSSSVSPVRTKSQSRSWSWISLDRETVSLLINSGDGMLPEPPMYLVLPPCWSKFATSFFRRDLPPSDEDVLKSKWVIEKKKKKSDVWMFWKLP